MKVRNLCICVLVGACAAGAPAQIANNTSLVGTVLDAGGAALASAKVEAIEESTKVSYQHRAARPGSVSLRSQRKQKRPAPFGPGTGLFRYRDGNFKHPNVGTSSAETNHAPRRVPETADRTSIGRPSGNLWRDASLAPSCEDQRGPCPSRGSPERPKPYKADCVRSHDCC